ncbi:MAG: dynamin family protein [Syntrophobacteraceae bacterium]
MLNYGGMKDNLHGVIERLSGSVREGAAQSLVEIKTKLEEETFNLVILGQFKRGKSTFINALLGESILPTAIVPLTSVVTILRYGPELEIEVRFIDGHRESVSLDDLTAYITERGNPRNKKKVKEVTVLYPSEYLKSGVRIIDTPGVGSVYRHNTDVAYSYLPYVDAGIFIVSADPPLSENEHQFLKNIRSYVDKIFFVLNKIDQVSDKDREESLEFTIRILEEDLGKGKVKISPLSARWALEGKKAGDRQSLERSLLPGFERHLKDFLIHEKGKVFLASITNSLLKLVSDETVSFQLEQEALKLPLQELKVKISRFEEEMKTIAKSREHNSYLLTGYLKKMNERLDNEIHTFKKESLPALLRDLNEEYHRQVKQAGGNLREDLEHYVFTKIQEIFTIWRQQLTEKIAAQLDEAHGWFAERTNETIERILTLTGDIFDLKLKPFTTIDTLTKKSHFYFLFKDDPVGLELVQLAVTSALPGFIAKKIILNKMRETVTDLLDRHCGRVRYDLLTRMASTVKDFQKTLNEKIDLTLEGIRISFQKALVLHQSSQQGVEKDMSEISRKLSVISLVQDELMACNTAVNGSFAP